MIQVTERAREALKAVQTQMTDKPEVALRLAQVEQGQLGVFPDTGRDDDHVVEHDGRAVLLIDPEVAGELAGSTIDFEESADGARLTLRR
jgi:Fe-S cluster assembly iron-binding protein IscA